MLYKFFAWIENLWATPPTTALEDAVAGLEDAKKQALTEKSMADYSAAKVLCHNAMADYQKKRVERLQDFINTQTEK